MNSLILKIRRYLSDPNPDPGQAQAFILNTADCCQFGWLTNSSSLYITSDVYCNGMPLMQAVNQSCTCKQQAYKYFEHLVPSGEICFNISNYTNTYNSTCSAHGCASGQRLYSIPLQPYPIINCSAEYSVFLFNTACQGK